MQTSATYQSQIKILIGLINLIMLASCTAMPQIPAAARTELAPTGTLRAAINYGNPILAVRDPATGEPRGVSVDLSRELARRLDVPVTFVIYEAAGKVVADLKSGTWDVACLAVDPARADEISFTAPYMMIEGAYLVTEASPIRRNEDVDRQGVSVVVGEGSAYDLFLSRNLKSATIVRAPTSPAVTDLFMAQKLDVAAGIRQQLEADARRIPGLRLLEGRFMVIHQAMGIPQGRTAGAEYLQKFIEEMKSSGFVSRRLEQHGIEGARVAP